MRFQFSLDAVLRVARIREECEWSKLQALEQERATFAAQCQEVQQAQINLRRDIASALDGTAPACWLQAGDVCLGALQRRENVLKTKLQEVTNRLREQHHVYLAARQKSEVLTRLRATRYDRFRREVARQEQIALDDVFLNRYR